MAVVSTHSVDYCAKKQNRANSFYRRNHDGRTGRLFARKESGADTKYIEAIEDSDAAALPSRAYTDGFLRNYATYLGMDPAEAVRRFAEENGLVSTPPRMSPVAPMPSAKKKKAAGGFASAGATPQKSGGGSLGRIAPKRVVAVL